MAGVIHTLINLNCNQKMKLVQLKAIFCCLFVVPEEPQGTVISVDLEHVRPLPGATVLDNSDIRSSDTLEQIKQVLNGRSVDVVLSDMAPAASGVRSLDHDCIVQLALSVLRLSATILTEV